MTQPNREAFAKLAEAKKFVHNWLWEGEGRETRQMPWEPEYIDDAAKMCIAYALRLAAQAQEDVISKNAIYHEFLTRGYTQEYAIRFIDAAITAEKGKA